MGTRIHHIHSVCGREISFSALSSPPILSKSTQPPPSAPPDHSTASRAEGRGRLYACASVAVQRRTSCDVCESTQGVNASTACVRCLFVATDICKCFPPHCLSSFPFQLGDEPRILTWRSFLPPEPKTNSRHRH